MYTPTQTESIAIQYNQFSSFFRATNIVAIMLKEVVCASMNGNAAPIYCQKNPKTKAKRTPEMRITPCKLNGKVVIDKVFSSGNRSSEPLLLSAC